MARPSLFVRPLEQGEMEFLAHLRKSRRQALRQRAQILMASMVYTPVYQIALICQTDEAYVRKVIHAFNDHGFESLNPKVGTGRPRKFEPAIRDRIVAIALTPPTTLGEPLTRWSLRRLKGYLERRRVVPRIAVETLRGMLREKNVTFQRTRSWKRSTDPLFGQRPPASWRCTAPAQPMGWWSALMSRPDLASALSRPLLRPAQTTLAAASDLRA